MRASTWLRSILAILLAFVVVGYVGAEEVSAQDFDFTDEGDSGGDDSGDDDAGSDSGGGDDGGGFDFTDETGGGGTTDSGTPAVTVDMPDGSKPIIVGWFDPVDATDPRVLNRLTDKLVEEFNTFEDMDAVNGIIIKQDLDRMGEDERIGCINDPACLADMGKALKVQHVVVGRIMTEGLERPKIALDLIDVETGALANFIEFEASQTVKGQERELRPAAYKLFNRKPPMDESKLGNTGPVEDPGLPLGQVIASIATGTVGLALIGTGAYFGAQASSIEDEINSGKGNGLTQMEAQTKLDDAESNALIANVLYGVGGVAIVTAVILVLVNPSDEIAEDQNADNLDFYVNPTVGAEGAGFVGGFTF